VVLKLCRFSFFKIGTKKSDVIIVEIVFYGQS